MTTPRTDAAYERYKAALQFPERDTDRAIVKALAEREPTRRATFGHGDYGQECVFCGAQEWDGLVHEDTCIWQRAKKRLEDPQVMIKEMLDEHLFAVAGAREEYLRTLLEEYFCRDIRNVVLVEDRTDPLKTTFHFALTLTPGETEWLGDLLDQPAKEPTEAMMRASERRRALFGE
jgi:hypothetical protein